MDTASLEVLLARGLSLEEIGRRFDRHPSTVAYWMRKHGLVAAKADKHAGRGGLALERLRPLVETGMTIAEIAAEVERSKATVRHWLGRYGLRTKNTRGRRPVEVMARAKEAGLLAVNMTCIRHGELSSRSRGAVTTGASGAGASRWRDIDARSRKHWWPKPAGRASSAGTTGALTALAFHHLDPTEKRLAISQNGVTLSLDTIRAEARKCVLVCANCHAEIESGAISLPDTVAAAVIRLNE